MHLMFEKPTAETAAAAAAEATAGASDFGRSNSVLPTFASYADMPGQHGSLAFDRGLEEICKYHSVDPETAKMSALKGMGFPDKFVQSALRLSNNSIDYAGGLIQLMKARSTELDATYTVGPGASPAGKPGKERSGSFLSSGFTTLSYAASGSRVNMSGKRPGGQVETLLSDSVGGIAGDADSVGSGNTTLLSLSEGSVRLTGDAPVCPECGKDDVATRDQLIPCTGCGQHYHATCVGHKRIPFTL